MKVDIDGLTEAIMDGLTEYKDILNDDVKKAVKKSARKVKSEIKKNAPVGVTGKYKKSWSTKKVKESSNAFSLSVHSKNRYQLAHLLEYGHAKRGGGRTRGKEHIKPAEDMGVKLLEEEIIRSIKNG